MRLFFRRKRKPNRGNPDIEIAQHKLEDIERRVDMLRAELNAQTRGERDQPTLHTDSS